MKKTRFLIIASILAVTITNLKCAKEPLKHEQARHMVLSKTSPDYSERMQAIRKNYYDLKLDEKFKPKIKDDVSWTPDWQHPTSQVISDSV